jgi:hypothetical protein
MKSKAAKRKRQAQIEVPQKHLKPAPVVTVDPDAAALGPSLHSVISDEEISITVETLVALAQYPNLIKSKACRDIRTAVYDFRQASTTGMNTAGPYILQLRNALPHSLTPSSQARISQRESRPH